MDRVVHRVGLGALVVGVVAVLAIAASSALLAWSYKDQLSELKQVIYTRCVERSTYDTHADAFKQALEGYYTDLLGNIRANSPDNAFYRRLTVRVEGVIAKARAAQNRPIGCDQYR